MHAMMYRAKSRRSYHLSFYIPQKGPLNLHPNRISLHRPLPLSPTIPLLNLYPPKCNCHTLLPIQRANTAPSIPPIPIPIPLSLSLSLSPYTPHPCPCPCPSIPPQKPASSLSAISVAKSVDWPSSCASLYRLASSAEFCLLAKV